MRKQGSHWASCIKTMAAVPRGRMAASAALCLGLVLGAAGMTLAEQPSDQRQRSGKVLAKAPTAGQKSPPVSASPSAGSRANQGTVPPPQTAQGVVWTLGHPPERLRFPANSEVQFPVSAGDKGVRNLRLVQSTLQDATTFFQLDASQLSLCADDANCGTTIDVPANTTKRLTLKISPAFHTPGIFTGEVSFGVAGKPETQSFKLTVYSRRPCAILLGGVLIAAGLFLYFLVNVWLRRSIAREEALFPAYQLRDTLATLRKRLADVETQTHLQFVLLTEVLNDLDRRLTRDALAGHLPPALIAPWSSATDWVANFSDYLRPISDQAAAMVVLVNSGVRTAMNYWTTHPDPVTAALGQIDALAPTVQNGGAAQAQLAPILQALQAAVIPPHPALPALLGVAPAGVVTRLFTLPPDTHTLQLRLMRNMLWVWCLVAVVALASGFYAVVLENFGFGSWADYIKCFFWGLGFSVAGTQLEQLTQTAVAGNFGISIPEA
jgi:hypothetical protein